MNPAEVLVIDPDAARRGALRAWLEGRGVGSTASQGVAGALEVLGEQVPLLLLVAPPVLEELLPEIGGSDGSPAVPVCVIGAVEVEQLRGWLELGLDHAIADPVTHPLAGARLLAILRACRRTAALREQAERARSALRLAGTWLEGSDFEARIRGLAPALRRLPAVSGYQLVLYADEQSTIVASDWPGDASGAWPAVLREEECPPTLARCLADGGIHTTSEGARTHEVVAPVPAGAEVLGALRILLRDAGAPSAEDRAFYLELGRMLGANLALWRSLSGMELRQGRLESAFAARFQELRSANRRLEKVNRMKDDFLGVITHDVKGPLSVIIGQGQLLDRGLLGPLTPNLEKAAGAILRQSARIRSIVDELRDRMQDSSEIEARREDVDLVQVLDGALGESLPAANDRGVQMERSVPPDEVIHFADPTQLREALVLMLSRAIERSAVGSAVHSGLRAPDETRRRVELYVEDSGPALDGQEERELLERVPGRRGLSWCRQVAREHGGQLWFEGTAGGGRLTLTLPVPAGDLPVVARMGRARVLLVQPDESLAQESRRALGLRFEVLEARRFEEVREQLLADPPDVLVLGLGPTDAGHALALIEVLRGEDRLRRLPLVLHTAVEEGAMRERLAGLGPLAVVAAPFAGRTLVRAVESVLEGRRGPPLPFADFLERLRRELERAAASDQPLSVLRIAHPPGAPAPGVEVLARWLEPRTRTADRLGLADEGQLLLQLPGAPAWAPERIAADLLEASREVGSGLLREGAILSWVSWQRGEEIDGPEELLARLDDPAHASTLPDPPSPSVPLP